MNKHTFRHKAERFAVQYFHVVAPTAIMLLVFGMVSIQYPIQCLSLFHCELNADGSQHEVHGAAPTNSILSSSGSLSGTFLHTVFPVDSIPNWGAMRSAAEWDRTYSQMDKSDYVPVPAYDRSLLTIPMALLARNLTTETISIITAKLFYSTRYFAAYDLDADEFTGAHSGVDLKLPIGTPIKAIAGGIVKYAANDGALGLHVMIRHRLPNGSTYFSMYGHFDTVSVKPGDNVTPGQVIGTVGMTGDTLAPHLHLQVDKATGTGAHIPYEPPYNPTRAAVMRWSVNPILFIQQHLGDELAKTMTPLYVKATSRGNRRGL